MGGVRQGEGEGEREDDRSSHVTSAETLTATQSKLTLLKLMSSSQKWSPGGKSISIASPGVRGLKGVRDTCGE